MPKINSSPVKILQNSKKFLQSSQNLVSKFISIVRSAAVKSPIKERDNCLQANRYHSITSWNPTYLKRAIDSKRPILSIGHIR